MKKTIIIVSLLVSTLSFAQKKDSTAVFKKRVLETTEVDFVSSYYNQNGSHAAVSGGIGTEKLSDFASNIIVAAPLNDDDVLTFDVGISAYTSASSSNVNPFNSHTTSTYTSTGASGRGGSVSTSSSPPDGTPWQSSTGASGQGALYALNTNYSHSSDDRNFMWNSDVSVSTEFNYNSFGFGGGITKLFNDKNSEISVKSNIYLDNWKIIYPTELHQYETYGTSFLTSGYFTGVTVLDQNGAASRSYLPNTFKPWTSTARNSYSASVSFSQVVNTKSQFSVFFDVLQQQGLLSTPYHRIYFADKTNFFIGQSQYIANYESTANTGVFKLADDIERLPDTRFKLPIGARLNYYINEYLVLRTYYRYYSDDWDIQAHTANVELPIKLSDKFTVFPTFRYYKQTASKFYAPYEKHFSTEQYYTSDPDLATFDTKQFGFGINYTDIFASAKIWQFGLKNIDFRFHQYERTDRLKASIATIAFKFIMQ